MCHYLVESVIVFGSDEKFKEEFGLVALGGVVGRIWHPTRQEALLVGKHELLYLFRILQQDILSYSYKNTSSQQVEFN
jgi:hypothetical protein